jgi:N-acetylmuramoyl-L-alanine amidase
VAFEDIRISTHSLITLASLFLMMALPGIFMTTPLRGDPPVHLLSPLAPQPNWAKLQRYAGTITAADFELLLQQVYVPDGSWKEWITLTPTAALITPGPGSAPITLALAPPGTTPKPPPRYWKDRTGRDPQPGLPLAGLKIALDPGHLGGSFAQMEERWFRIGNAPPVEEGEMTLIVAKLLKRRLEAMGAAVWLTRRKNGATTPLRPDQLKNTALGSLQAEHLPVTNDQLKHEADLLFYRVGEIRNRARLVNRIIRPDLVVCLHFNAEAWGDPRHPTLTDKNHLHLILCGAMSGEELQHEDERYTMLVKLLSGTHREELAVSESVSRALAAATGLPPFVYHGPKAIPASDNPYLWIRNLLANRLFECPVVYCEPYVMNSTPVFNRIQLGDYRGLRMVDGMSRKSIYREYADAVAQGLADYYGGAAH